MKNFYRRFERNSSVQLLAINSIQHPDVPGHLRNRQHQTICVECYLRGTKFVAGRHFFHFPPTTPRARPPRNVLEVIIHRLTAAVPFGARELRTAGRFGGRQIAAAMQQTATHLCVAQNPFRAKRTPDLYHRDPRTHWLDFFISFLLRIFLFEFSHDLKRVSTPARNRVAVP
jgi:hypothetical protein